RTPSALERSKENTGQRSVTSPEHFCPGIRFPTRPLLIRYTRLIGTNRSFATIVSDPVPFIPATRHVFLMVKSVIGAAKAPPGPSPPSGSVMAQYIHSA